jgi:hypothetical protein
VKKGRKKMKKSRLTADYMDETDEPVPKLIYIGVFLSVDKAEGINREGARRRIRMAFAGLIARRL